MRRYSIVITTVTLLAAGGGYLLRRYELMTAFEPLSGLAIRGAAATLLLYALTACFALAAIFIATYVSVRSKLPDSYEDAFGTCTIAYPLMFVPVWLMWITGTVIHTLGLLSSDALQAIDIYFAVFSVLAAISVSFFTVGIFQNPNHKSLYVLSVVPIAFLCFWLILLYRQNAANPVLLSFVYICLAIVTSTLSCYYTAGFLYGKPAPGKAVFVYCTAVYLCAVTLADRHDPGILLIIASLLLSALINLFTLTRSLQQKTAADKAVIHASFDINDDI